MDAFYQYIMPRSMSKVAVFRPERKLNKWITKSNWNKDNSDPVNWTIWTRFLVIIVMTKLVKLWTRPALIVILTANNLLWSCYLFYQFWQLVGQRLFKCADLKFKGVPDNLWQVLPVFVCWEALLSSLEVWWTGWGPGGPDGPLGGQ